MNAKLIIYRRRTVVRSQRWGWRLVAANGRIIATSGEGYYHRTGALTMGRSVTHGVYENATEVVPVVIHRLTDTERATGRRYIAAARAALAATRDEFPAVTERHHVDQALATTRAVR